MISRRCLICANYNPCSSHSEEAQEAELRRNDEEIAKIRGDRSLVEVVARMVDPTAPFDKPIPIKDGVIDKSHPDYDPPLTGRVGQAMRRAQEIVDLVRRWSL